MSWLRWWTGTVNDPKWRLVARAANVRPGDCVAVWAYLLEIAKPGEGDIAALDLEECSVVLDYELDAVERIVAAMRSRALIEGDKIASWSKRQPKREDDSNARVAAYRARKREQTQAISTETQRNARVTQCNAPETDTDTETDTKPDGFVGARADADAPPAPKRGSSKSETRGHRLPADWSPDPADAERLGWDAAVVAEEAPKFCDYWRAQPGERGRKVDWHATFRNWMRKALEDRARLAARRPSSQAQAPPNGSSQAFVGSSSSDIALRVKSYQRLAEQCEARGDQHGARNWQFKADQARMAMQ